MPGGLTEAMSPEQVARMFHECYERLAPSFGYETRKETRSFDAHSANGKLMIAVCELVARAIEREVLATTRKRTAEQVARLFHDTYERLAPSFGYETRADTKQFDPASPNGKLMIAVCAELERLLRGEA